ncbi:high-potential iron-sulfur protein [Paraburkholderia saeva]|uniref:High-potential iron-sulfur protein n=1 Tax=Paraburkholderia saeva TaxID=2777537 RepID=A0A9N8RX89_9BURK|nr:high-potential iron-sulfur protein [Paraburkholderia saeva]CAG4892820.1 hypothetical protein R70241_01455 [Paraburkholderia saeva]CAG4898390.1 hypothetical protein LMG31841_02612 [Paraburkholderia saeva]CAG4900625.1 hypothetical protein R52603_02763 [Paraburkholderia saeva]
MQASRRSFLILSAGMVSSLALSRAAIADAPKLTEDDPAAQKLGYRLDAAKVDRAKFPSWAAGQTCSNCSLFQGGASDPYGGCALFGPKQVAARGWCTSWTNS